MSGEENACNLATTNRSNVSLLFGLSAQHIPLPIHTAFDSDFFLAGFDCVSVDPTQFKELFRRHFGVLLNARELGILVRAGNSGERANSAAFVKTLRCFVQRNDNGRSVPNSSVMPGCVGGGARGFSPVVSTARFITVLAAVYDVRSGGRFSHTMCVRC